MTQFVSLASAGCTVANTPPAEIRVMAAAADMKRSTEAIVTTHTGSLYSTYVSARRTGFDSHVHVQRYPRTRRRLGFTLQLDCADVTFSRQPPPGDHFAG
jgi:hypothetical protein